MKIQKLLIFLVVGLALSAWADDAKKPVDSLLGKCPEGFTYFDNHNECIPPGEIHEVDGVPMEEIIRVQDAHRDDLHAIKGVVSSGIDQHGMFVEVLPDHDPVPSDLEGIPVHVHPYAYEVLIGADMPSF